MLKSLQLTVSLAYGMWTPQESDIRQWHKKMTKFSYAKFETVITVITVCWYAMTWQHLRFFHIRYIFPQKLSVLMLKQSYINRCVSTCILVLSKLHKRAHHGIHFIYFQITVNTFFSSFLPRENVFFFHTYFILKTWFWTRMSKNKVTNLMRQKWPKTT